MIANCCANIYSKPWHMSIIHTTPYHTGTSTLIFCSLEPRASCSPWPQASPSGFPGAGDYPSCFSFFSFWLEFGARKSRTLENWRVHWCLRRYSWCESFGASEVVMLFSEWVGGFACLTRWFGVTWTSSLRLGVSRGYSRTFSVVFPTIIRLLGVRCVASFCP